MSFSSNIWSNYQIDEMSTPILILCLLAIGLAWYKWLIKKSKKSAPPLPPPLPPGPWGLPVVGNLPFLDSDLHRYFTDLSKNYGPIIKVQLGSKVCIVLNSASVAKQVLKDHDTIFANRDVPAVGFIGFYGGFDITWSPYGDHWRMLRKVCVQDLLSNVRLEASYSLRQREVRYMVNQVFNKVGEPFDIAEFVLVIMFNVMTSMLWGGTFERDERERIAVEFRQVLEKTFKMLGTPNVSDLFPVLGVFDLQGLECRMKRLSLWFDKIFDYVIDRRVKMETRGEENQKKDFLEVLLQFKEHGEHKIPFTVTHVKALLMDMVVGGTKTSSTTIEWAMAEFMKHPTIMKKIQQELDDVVGPNNIVEEFHLPKCYYLTAVAKEVLRLHPAVPLLLPRRPSESCLIGGYTVPEGAKVLVNAWAIHRDPEHWNEPLEFRPERFLGSVSEYDFNGTNYNYIPFGSGRRICVGMPLAERMVLYMLASLLHSFDWALPEGTMLDMTEEFGIELKKKIPLVAIPTARLSEPKLYI